MVNQSKPAVAIFGGSFDPPHKGHQQIVESVIENLDIDKLLVVPAYLNPFKRTSLASASKRLEWCKTLFHHIPKVSVEAYEIEQGRSTTTSETVKHFNMIYTVKYLIIGADNLASLTKWHEFDALNAQVTWVIVTRDGYELAVDRLHQWKILTLSNDISSTKIRKGQDVAYVDNKIKTSVHNVLQGNTIMTIEERIENIISILDDKKAEEIEVFNLEDADYIAKRVVIANSLNGKHTLALFDHLKKGLKQKGDSILASDTSDEWVVADLGDILIHVMILEYRQRYSLEQFLNELVANQKKNEERDPV